MEILTATKIKKENEDYFNNPSPALKKLYESLQRLQEAIFVPLIERVKQIKNQS